MKEILEFDMLHSPLSGVNLVEASAGTGKTYAIVGVFLRLVMEAGLEVENILVVTFTEAATQELKERIRSRLRDAVALFSGARPADDALLQKLVEKYMDRRKKVLARLRLALQLFDQASIFTIHGFCNRMLREHAFESGIHFDTELVTSQDALKQQVAADFWRSSFSRSTRLFVDYAVAEKGIYPWTLSALLNGAILSGAVKMLPADDNATDLNAAVCEAESRFNDSFAALTRAWNEHRAKVVNILSYSDSFHRGKYKKERIPLWIGAMDQYTAMPSGTPLLFDKFEKFTTSGVVQGARSGARPETHPFFDICEDHQSISRALVALFEKGIAVLKRDFVDYARQALSSRKKHKNIHYFDDLVANVDAALKTDNRGLLQKTISKRYRAVLIDEFQDTDPMQYDIFSRLFARSKALFLIGDPKQAIYGFRGADIFAYLNAARRTDAAYTLKWNWRSAPALVHGVNALFSASDNPFVIDGIGFNPVTPAAEAAIPQFTINGESADGINVRIFDKDGFPDITGKAEWAEAVAGQTAARIRALIHQGRCGKAMLGDRPVCEADMAVLVRRHIEAEMVQRCLANMNINSIILKTGNLFDSHEAFEIEVLLNAVAAPADDSLVRAGLATDLLGWSAAAIEAFVSGDGAVSSGTVSKTTVFYECRDLWQRNGFIRMFNHMVCYARVLPRLMQFSDGERRCTNLFHLAEVLHRTAVCRNYGPEALLKWLARQRNPEMREAEEYPLRLESDDKAVNIITIHKSKGLEYPVVFVPFLWGAAARQMGEGGMIYHDPEDNMTPTVDFRAGEEQSPEVRAHAEKEAFAEAMRLAYVALTRAKNHCCVAYVPDKAAGSPLSYLFSDGNGNALAGLQSIVADAGGTIGVSGAVTAFVMDNEASPDAAASEQRFSCRRFSGIISRDWRVLSFSFMSRSRGEGLAADTPPPVLQMDDNRFSTDDVDVADLNAASETTSAPGENPEDVQAGIVHFPKGAAAGLFMHEIFEHLDFTEKDPGQRETLVAEGLSRYNFDARWQSVVSEMVSQVLSVELPSPAGGRSVCLETVSPDRRINELAFYFPLRRVSPEGIADLYRGVETAPPKNGIADRIDRLTFSPARGFMKGFIDLVFYDGGYYYIVDWKSNFLGTRPAAYHREKLYDEMVSSCYLLQAHIYAVALNAYLKTRVPGYDYTTGFGGIFYVFVRGVDRDRGAEYGVYREKPPSMLIERLTDYLIDHSKRKFTDE